MNIISTINTNLPLNVSTDKTAIYKIHDVLACSRINRAAFMSIKSIKEFDDRIWIFEINNKQVILDLEKLKCTCSCADYNLTMQSKGLYCKHIYKSIDWLVTSKTKSNIIDSKQAVKIELKLHD